MASNIPYGRYATVAIAGALFVMAAGQFWPGYQLDSTAKEAVEKAVDDALKPVATNFLPALCVELAQADPERSAKIESINAVKGYQKTSKLLDTGWVDVPGYTTLSPANKRILADGCQLLLFPPAEATNTAPG